MNKTIGFHFITGMHLSSSWVKYNKLKPRIFVKDSKQISITYSQWNIESALWVKIVPWMKIKYMFCWNITAPLGMLDKANTLNPNSPLNLHVHFNYRMSLIWFYHNQIQVLEYRFLEIEKSCLAKFIFVKTQTLVIG